jgi:alkanesulfonate monooxygenase SsuD/methylene tetrahydromethanopterin reductase-like flavin-dependent oxidoreductase (luciferase family)
MEEQIEVLRLLWKQPLVTFEGQWHHIPDAGVEPRPVHGSIPIWFGGHDDRVLQRMARLGDGWMTGFRKPEDAAEAMEKLSGYLDQNGRSWGSDFGLEPRMHYSATTPDDWPKLIEGWTAAGATHISMNTMDAGFTTPQQHLDALRQFADAVGVKA